MLGAGPHGGSRTHEQKLQRGQKFGSIKAFLKQGEAIANHLQPACFPVLRPRCGKAAPRSVQKQRISVLRVILIDSRLSQRLAMLRTRKNHVFSLHPII